MTEQSFETFLATWVTENGRDIVGTVGADDFDQVCRQRAAQLADAVQRRAYRSDLARLTRGYDGDVSFLVRNLFLAYASVRPSGR